MNTRSYAETPAMPVLAIFLGVLGGFILGSIVITRFDYSLPLHLLALAVMLIGVGCLLNDYLQKPSSSPFLYGLYSFFAYTAFTVLFFEGLGF